MQGVESTDNCCTNVGSKRKNKLEKELLKYRYLKNLLKYNNKVVTSHLWFQYLHSHLLKLCLCLKQPTCADFF